MEKDLFEEVAVSVGCTFISDMRFEPFNGYAKEMLSKYIDITRYPLKTLSDMYEYLYGKKQDFAKYGEAKAAFL